MSRKAKVADVEGAPQFGGAATFGTWEQAVLWLRSQPDQQDLVQAAYYDDPLLMASERYWRSEEWQAVRSLLPDRPGTALDVGAGRGIASFALAKEGFAVTALEPDPSAVVGAAAIRSLMREAQLPVTVTQEYSERLPFDDNSFDLVFARAVLHHTRDIKAACREFHRVLRPGGHLVAIREHVISRHEDLGAFLALHPLHRLYGGENAFLLDEYREALRQAAFGSIQCIAPLQSPVNYAPHTQRAIRREFALKAGPGPLHRPLHALLQFDWVWQGLQPLLERIDHRPGRHYSFVCRKSTT